MNYADKIDGCNYFTWHEALWLPEWQCYHTPSEEEKQNIRKLALIMDAIREYIKVSIKVHVWIRPILNNPSSRYNGKDYNALIGGAPNSAHKIGSAVDWDAIGVNCDTMRAKLLGLLEGLEIRMENKPKSNWIHIDTYPPKPNRYFIP